MKCDICGDKPIFTYKKTFCKKCLKKNKKIYLRYLHGCEIILGAMTKGVWRSGNTRMKYILMPF